MSSTRPGNGSTKFNVTCDDMGGWVRAMADGSPPSPGDLALYLSHGLTEWFRQHPHLRLICVAPVTKGGETAELHAWYEQHVFPDTSGLA
jgi:hypothetical protein